MDHSSNNNGKKKNPWGASQPQNTNSDNNPIGKSDIPDIDDLLRKARENFGFGRRSSENGQGISDGGDKKIILFAVLILALLWAGSGLYRVDPKENAVIQRFGALSRIQTQPGIGYHLPWPIEAITKLNVTEDRRVTIGFAEGRFHGANRIDVPGESLMLTADANILDIDVVVLWNIESAHDYLFNIRNPEDSIKRVAESALREIVGQSNLQQIITTGRDQVASRIQELTQNVLNSYQSGVSIKQVLIQDATVHPDVMEAFDDVVAAAQDAERFKNEASIYRNDIIPRARGEAIKKLQEAEAYRESRIARAKGDAERFNQLYEAYKQGRDVTRERIYIETMENVMKNSQTTIIGQDKNSMGVVPYLPLNRQILPQQ